MKIRFALLAEAAQEPNDPNGVTVRNAGIVRYTVPFATAQIALVLVVQVEVSAADLVTHPPIGIELRDADDHLVTDGGLDLLSGLGDVSDDFRGVLALTVVAPPLFYDVRHAGIHRIRLTNVDNPLDITFDVRTLS